MSEVKAKSTSAAAPALETKRAPLKLVEIRDIIPASSLGRFASLAQPLQLCVLAFFEPRDVVDFCQISHGLRALSVLFFKQLREFDFGYYLPAKPEFALGMVLRFASSLQRFAGFIGPHTGPILQTVSLYLDQPLRTPDDVWCRVLNTNAPSLRSMRVDRWSSRSLDLAPLCDKLESMTVYDDPDSLPHPQLNPVEFRLSLLHSVRACPKLCKLKIDSEDDARYFLDPPTLQALCSSMFEIAAVTIADPLWQFARWRSSSCTICPTSSSILCLVPACARSSCSNWTLGR
jgi:hypothetical protein